MNFSLNGFLFFIVFCVVILILSLGSLIFVQDHTKHTISKTISTEKSSISTPENTVVITKTLDLSQLNYEKIFVHGVKITSYNNEVKQTDSTPNVSSSNRIIYEGAVAISSDLIKKYGLKFGDVIYIPVLKSYYVFEDKMGNGRKTNERVVNSCIDVFMYDKVKAKNFRHLDQDVTIYKFPRNQ